MKSAVSPHKLLFFFQNLSPSLDLERHNYYTFIDIISIRRETARKNSQACAVIIKKTHM